MEEKGFISKDKIQQEFKQYADFAYSKNLMAMAMTIILASAMQKFVNSISENAIMPVINYFVGTATQGNWRTIVFTPVTGMDFEIGKITAGFLEFSITTALLYLIYIKIIKKISPDFTLEEKRS